MAIFVAHELKGARSRIWLRRKGWRPVKPFARQNDPGHVVSRIFGYRLEELPQIRRVYESKGSLIGRTLEPAIANLFLVRPSHGNTLLVLVFDPDVLSKSAHDSIRRPGVASTKNYISQLGFEVDDTRNVLSLSCELTPQDTPRFDDGAYFRVTSHKEGDKISHEIARWLVVFGAAERSTINHAINVLAKNSTSMRALRAFLPFWIHRSMQHPATENESIAHLAHSILERLRLEDQRADVEKQARAIATAWIQAIVIIGIGMQILAWNR